MRYLSSDAEIELVASAIARRLASPVRAASPVGPNLDIESVASAIARQLAPPARVASAAEINIDSIASAVARQLAVGVYYTPQALASAVASRIDSPARAAVAPTLAHAEIKEEALASQVTRRLTSLSAPVSPEKVVENLASAIAARLQQPTISIPAVEFERLASRVASTINQRLAPQKSPSEPLPSADTVDASEALKTEEQKTRKRPKPPESSEAS